MALWSGALLAHAPAKLPDDVLLATLRWLAATSHSQLSRVGRRSSRPSAEQFLVGRLVSGRPYHHAVSCVHLQVEASGNRKLHKFASNRLKRQASPVGHQHAIGRRQRVLRHRVPISAAFSGVGSPTGMLRGSLLRLALRWSRSSGSALRAASSMSGQRRRSSSNDRNGTCHAFKGGSHRAQGTIRNSETTPREYEVRTKSGRQPPSRGW